MQGLAGCFGRGDRQLVGQMLARIKHRGPDASRVLESNNVVIGSGALARPSGSNVQCIAEEEGVAVSADSYIFNKRELVKEYFGTQPNRTISDNELLLEMYRSAGLEMFSMIDGAFAIAIVDSGKLILARDRLGIKPLFHSGDSKSGSYASEMKAQLVTGSYFSPFPPGKIFIQGRGVKAMPEPKRKESSKDENLQEALRRLLVKSTDACIEDSDSVNILLSGGIDSGAIAAVAMLNPVRIDTVCVGIEGSEDLEMARKVAAHLGTNHIEKAYDLDDLLQLVDNVIYAVESFDYPLIRNCLPNYMASHAFLRRNRITLSGDGGDEVFAGYTELQKIKSDSKLRKERMALLAKAHVTSFLRVDRCNASACLDARLPLVERNIMDLGLGLGRKDLLGTGPRENKLLLRRAVEGLLPKEVIWRPKQKFGKKAGPSHMLQEYADDAISDAEFEKERKLLPKGRIRTKEELLYFRSFQKFFHNKSSYDAVGYTEPR